MRWQRIKRGPKSLFLRLAVCTTIRGKSLGSYLQLSFHSQLSFQAGSLPWRSENVFEGLLWVPVVGCGNARWAEAGKMGPAFVQVLKYQQLCIRTFPWYLWLFSWHQNESSSSLISSTASGGSWCPDRVVWCGRARARFSQISLVPHFLPEPQFPYQ